MVVEYPLTLAFLGKVLEKDLVALDIQQPLDVSLMRGRDRRIPRLVSRWADNQQDESGSPVFSGLRYESKLGKYECWAIFDGTPMRGMACELALLRVRWQGEDRSVPRRVQLAIVLGFLGGLRYSTRFKFHWIEDLARETSFRGAWRAMRVYRRGVRGNRRAEGERKARLDRLAGVGGVEPASVQLDRREFHETKDALVDVYFTQAGYFRLHRRYESDAAAMFRLRLLPNLPEDHQIQFRVSKDRRKWRAWRQTPGGYVFAVGGTQNINQEWRFDGDDPSDDFPSKWTLRWRNMMIEQESPEWARDDAPIPDS